LYTILINDDNTMIATKQQRIMQRSKLVDELWFLANPIYNGYNMADFTLSMEYVLPVSRKYRHEILTLSNERYNGYLQYTVPVNTDLTAEAGDIEIKLTFIHSDLDVNGKSIQRVRKIESTILPVLPTSAWSEVIPDEALDTLDQRIIMLNSTARAIEETVNYINLNKADDIKYNDNENSIQLMSGKETIGTKVVIKTGAADIADGIPVVDFNSVKPTEPSEKEEQDNVVEF